MARDVRLDAPVDRRPLRAVELELPRLPAKRSHREGGRRVRRIHDAACGRLILERRAPAEEIEPRLGRHPVAPNGPEDDEVVTGRLPRAERLVRRLSPVLLVLRAHEEHVCPREEEAEVEVGHRVRPLVPLEESADRRTVGPDEGVALVSVRSPLEQLVTVRVRVRTRPVRVRVVPDGIDPQDPVRAGVGDDGADRAASVATRRLVPADGVVDDIDALALRVRLGACEVELRPHADEVQLRIRRHVVDDLRNGRSVLGRGRELAFAIVLRHHVRWELAFGLTLREPLEAAVDHSDLHALPGEALRVPRPGEIEGDLLARHGLLDRAGGGANASDRRLSRERRKACGRDDGLDEAVPCSLDAAATSEDRCTCVGWASCLDDDAHLSIGRPGEAARADARDGRTPGAPASEAREAAVELRRVGNARDRERRRALEDLDALRKRAVRQERTRPFEATRSRRSGGDHEQRADRDAAGRPRGKSPSEADHDLPPS